MTATVLDVYQTLCGVILLACTVPAVNRMTGRTDHLVRLVYVAAGSFGLFASLGSVARIATATPESVMSLCVLTLFFLADRRRTGIPHDH